MKKVVPAIIILAYILSAFSAQAQTQVNLRAKDLMPHTEISITPKSGIFVEGSTFEVPIIIDTKKNSINTIELNINFDPKKLTIVRPSGGKSIIGLWVQPPTYDNVRGTASVVGTIPGGITTNSGLIIAITFQAKATGRAEVSIGTNSTVLLNDGLGSQTILDTSRGVYEIVPKLPDGVRVFSDTHPFQESWYNNNSPTVAWEIDPGVSAFSYVLDNNPNTIPDNNLLPLTTTKSFENLKDGLWYFHIKAFKEGGWSTTAHFILRIDTTPPAEFAPSVGYLTSTETPRSLVSFLTTDTLSGVEHYEIGVIDKADSTTSSPIFVQTESPYQLPSDQIKNAQVIVRAFDHAGNIREGFVDISVPNLIWKFVSDNKITLLIGALILFALLLLSHYLFGHHIIRHAKNIIRTIKKEERLEELNDLKEEIAKEEQEL